MTTEKSRYIGRCGTGHSLEHIGHATVACVYIQSGSSQMEWTSMPCIIHQGPAIQLACCTLRLSRLVNDHNLSLLPVLLHHLPPHLTLMLRMMPARHEYRQRVPTISNITVQAYLQHFEQSALYHSLCLQCFDAVGWAAGRASGL